MCRGQSMVQQSRDLLVTHKTPAAAAPQAQQQVLLLLVVLMSAQTRGVLPAAAVL